MKLSEYLSNLTWKSIILFAFITMLLFSISFYIISVYSPANGLSGEGISLLSSIYFGITSFISISYGDIVPHGISRVLSIIEAFLGLLFIGFLVSKLVSMREEKMITKLYHLQYIQYFREMRDDLGDFRLSLRKLTTDLMENPNNITFIDKLDDLLKNRDKGYFRFLYKTMAGIQGFLEIEERRGEPIIYEIDIYYIERLLNSIDLTIKEVYSSLERLDSINYPLEHKILKGDLNSFLNISIKACDWINKHYQSEAIAFKYSEIKEYSKQIRDKYCTTDIPINEQKSFENKVFKHAELLGYIDVTEEIKDPILHKTILNCRNYLNFIIKSNKYQNYRFFMILNKYYWSAIVSDVRLINKRLNSIYDHLNQSQIEKLSDTMVFIVIEEELSFEHRQKLECIEFEGKFKPKLVVWDKDSLENISTN